ncbi:hypothetical protein [Bacillus atrophaeus]|nr:hypothetical protein [Bacillus atrophaeus]
MTTAAKEQSVKVSPVSPSFKNKPPFVSVLIGYGALSENEIRNGIKKLKHVVTPMDRLAQDKKTGQLPGLFFSKKSRLNLKRRL